MKSLLAVFLFHSRPNDRCETITSGDYPEKQLWYIPDTNTSFISSNSQTINTYFACEHRTKWSKYNLKMRYSIFHRVSVKVLTECIKVENQCWEVRYYNRKTSPYWAQSCCNIRHNLSLGFSCNTQLCRITTCGGL